MDRSAGPIARPPSPGWLRRVGPWVGIGTSPAALMMGGGVAQGLHGAAIAAALVLGVLLLAGLAAAQGLLGQRTGRSLAELTAGPLGRRGSRRTASVVVLAMMLGWLGVNAGVAGVAVARLAGVPDAAGVTLFCAVMLAVAAWGIGVLSASALVAGLATTALAAYGLSLALEGREVGLSGAATGSEPVGFLPAVVLVIGYGAAFALRTPDFTRDLARPRQVVWCALAGLAAPLVLFALAGALLQAATGSWDLAEVLRRLGSPTLAYLFVAVGFTGSVLTNLYSGALSLSDAAPGVPRAGALAAVALVGGGLAAAGFASLMLPYLTLMAIAAPTLVALCMIHALRGAEARLGWGRPGLVAWGAGVAGGIALHLAGSPLAIPAAIAVASAVYWPFAGRPRPNPRLLDPTPEGP